MGRSLQVSQQQTTSLVRSKMGLKLVLFIFSILYLSLTTAVEDDSKHLSNSQANPIGANLAGHQLMKREAGRGRKKSCEGKRCSKKKTSKRAKKDKKSNQRPKKRKGRVSEGNNCKGEKRRRTTQRRKKSQE